MTLEGVVNATNARSSLDIPKYDALACDDLKEKWGSLVSYFVPIEGAYYLVCDLVGWAVGKEGEYSGIGHHSVYHWTIQTEPEYITTT